MTDTDVLKRTLSLMTGSSMFKNVYRKGPPHFVDVTPTPLERTFKTNTSLQVTTPKNTRSLNRENTIGFNIWFIVLSVLLQTSIGPSASSRHTLYFWVRHEFQQHCDSYERGWLADWQAANNRRVGRVLSWTSVWVYKAPEWYSSENKQGYKKNYSARDMYFLVSQSEISRTMRRYSTRL